MSGLDPRVLGVSRMVDNDQAILISFDRPLYDSELRQLHETLRALNTPASLPSPETAGLVERLNAEGHLPNQSDDRIALWLEAADALTRLSPGWRSDMRETMWATVTFEEGDKAPMWACSTENDMGDGATLVALELRASTFPVGTRLSISEPAWTDDEEDAAPAAPKENGR